MRERLAARQASTYQPDRELDTRACANNDTPVWEATSGTAPSAVG